MLRGIFILVTVLLFQSKKEEQLLFIKQHHFCQKRTIIICQTASTCFYHCLNVAYIIWALLSDQFITYIIIPKLLQHSDKHTQNCGSFKRFIAARQEGFIKYFTTTWISLCLLQQLIVPQYESCTCVLSDISNNKCGSSGKSLRFRKFFTENKLEILWYLDWEISLKSWEYIAERHHEWTQRGCLGKGVRHACIQSDCDPCDVWWRGTHHLSYNN